MGCVVVPETPDDPTLPPSGCSVGRTEPSGQFARSCSGRSASGLPDSAPEVPPTFRIPLAQSLLCLCDQASQGRIDQAVLKPI